MWEGGGSARGSEGRRRGAEAAARLWRALKAVAQLWRRRGGGSAAMEGGELEA